MKLHCTSHGLVLLAAFAVAAGSVAIGVSPAQAKDGAREAREASKEAARQAEELAKQAQEQAREQAKQAQEQAREQAREAREQAREQARQARASNSNSDAGTSRENQGSGKTNSAATEQSKPDGSGSKSGVDSANGDKTGAKTSDKDKSAAADKSGDKSGASAPEDNKVPGTVAEWLQDVLKPAAKPAAQAATPAAALAAAPAVGPAPAKVQPAAPLTPGAGKLAGHNTPQLPSGRPEMLAVNMSPKGLARAVALGFSANGATQVSRIDLGLTRLVAPAGMSAEQARDLLRQALPGEGVEINQKYRIYRTANGVQPASLATPAKPPTPMATPCGTDRCFGSAVINWRQPLQECARSIRIGVIDTGYDAGHPAFHNRTIHPFRSPSAGHEKSPDWHGTGVLALLAGDAKSGTPGLVPLAKFYLADIFFADSDGAPASDTASLLAALDWLDKQSVKIVNMSLTGPPDELLKAAITGLSAKGIIFVAAVGNDGPAAPPSYPAAYQPVVAVTAVDKDMISYRYASRGAHVSVSAPGVDIWTALPNGQAGYHSGTSFAVPFVTAVLATVYKDLTTKSKKAFLDQADITDLGADGPDPIYGRGLLKAPLTCRPDPAPVPSKTQAIVSAVSGAAIQVSAGR